MATAVEQKTRSIALVGNPNTGKSTLFTALAGVRQRIGNYPGVTVEKKVGHMEHAGQGWALVDLPGTYSLAPRSLDEMVVVDVLLGRRDDVPPCDAIVCIVDASNLERNLYLVSQVLELGRPTVVALNMTDIAQQHGLKIDAAALAKRLGIPVVPVQANKRRGLAELKAALAEIDSAAAAKIESPFPAEFRAEVSQLESLLNNSKSNGQPSVPRYLVERLLLDTGGYLEQSDLFHVSG
ncbi:MAG TPA: FeoB small GTPase domain-containing protein, partial [Pirellulales bacterium]